MDSSLLWKKCLEVIEQHLSPQHFETWFRPIKVIPGDETGLELEVPNRFFLEWIKEHYLALIQEECIKTAGKEVTIHWKISENRPGVVTDKKAMARQGSSSRTRTAKKHSSLGLSNRYTFDNFVVGPANEFAHAASFAITKQLASKYNPLFIYGGVGLGKTHLLHAIGNLVFNNSNATNVCYYTSERFMNEFINYVSRHKMSDFRKKFRNVDILLVDDIQFWAGKERTQEEFFHTFNVLYEAHKQIVVTSDKFPKDIGGIEERLRSRFEWGLVADIQPPDTETKIAILKKKAVAANIKLPDEVAVWVASVSGTNIRELEGFLNRLIAFSSLTGREITLSMSKEALKNLLRNCNEKILSINYIQKIVAAFYNIKISDIKSNRRYKTITLPRQVAMFLSREYGKFSYPEIGSAFGGKDHSTAIYAVKKITTCINEDPEFERTVRSLKSDLGVS